MIFPGYVNAFQKAPEIDGSMMVLSWPNPFINEIHEQPIHCQLGHILQRLGTSDQTQKMRGLETLPQGFPKK